MGDVFVQVSFDVPNFAKHLSAQDPVALVMRAHLYAEAALIRLIESTFVRKEAFDTVTRLQFLSKVDLAIALGKVDPRGRGGYAALNKLRNRFAHDLNTQLVEKDELDFYNALSDKQREFANASRKPKLPLMGRLRCDLVGLIMHLEAMANKAPRGFTQP